MKTPALHRFFDQLPVWVPLCLIAGCVMIVSLLFLYPSPDEFPMDDTYIHFVYAENLAKQGKLYFNFPDEPGVGTTSILWVLLLSGGYKLGISLNLTAKILGMTALITLGWFVYYLLKPLRSLPALLAALLVVLAGNLIWFSLSGMETVLFLSLGMLAILTYRAEKWVPLGIVLGLLTLTRIEGLALLAVIGLTEIFRNRRITSGLLVTGFVCLAIAMPWYGYLYWRSGYFLPTSGIGKKLSMGVAINYVVSRSEVLAALNRIPGFTYLGLLLIYLLEFALGGMSFPPPNVPIGTMVENVNYTVSLWAVIGWVGVVFPLLWAAFRRFWEPRRWGLWMQDRTQSTMFVLLLWVVLHNLSYIIFLPSLGTASRYTALTHVVMWIALVVGLLRVSRETRMQFVLASGLVLIAIMNTVYWNRVYDANLVHMTKVRIRAARYIRDHLPQDQFLGASDVGALRYFSQAPIFDLGGLVDPAAGQWYMKGQYDRYLLENEVAHIFLPGRMGTKEEGWFDSAKILGLSDSKLFKMQESAVFEIDQEQWLLGYLATNNYQASVVLYQLQDVNQYSTTQ